MSKRTFFISILLAGILGSLLTTGTAWLLSSTFVSDTMKSRGMSMHQIPPWQMYLSNDLAFLNTTSLTAGDLLYYDATNAEWLNTQGQGTISGIGSSPAITLENPTAEDTDGGRESEIRFCGEDSTGSKHMLAKIMASHNGVGTDENASLEAYINDGNDGDSPSKIIKLELNNTAIGIDALASITSGTHNNGIGYASIDVTTTGLRNNALGGGTLGANIGGNYNLALGHGALGGNTSGNGNIGLGYLAGDNITTGSYNLILGYDNNATSATGNFQIDIADTIYGNSSNKNVTVTAGLTLAKVTADPCGDTNAFPEASIWYNDTDNVLCFCDGTNDLKIADGSACF